MINGLQLLMHYPSLNVEPPAVAFTVINQLLDVFTFDIGYEDWNLDITVLGEAFESPANDEIFNDIDEKY